jgi:hypothetical protein
MALIKERMILGTNKNVYVEPVIWTAEYVQRKKYRYSQTTSTDRTQRVLSRGA